MEALSNFRAYGLTIASEFEIIGGTRLERVLPSADIIIAAGDTAIGDIEAINGPYSRCGNGLLFDAAGIARYFAPSPNHLFIEPYRNADARQIGELLIATALPMLIWMRGGIILHAAGIVPDGMDCAIAITGPSGIGKSVLAGSLIEQGGRLVGDDSLWLTLRGNKSFISGLSATMFRAQGLNSPRTEIAIPPNSQKSEAELGAIIALRIESGAMQTTPRRLHGADAIEAFLQNRHRPKIPAILGLEAALLPQCMLHCQALPIYGLTIRNGDIAGAQQQIATLISGNL